MGSLTSEISALKIDKENALEEMVASKSEFEVLISKLELEKENLNLELESLAKNVNLKDDSLKKISQVYRQNEMQFKEAELKNCNIMKDFQLLSEKCEKLEFDLKESKQVIINKDEQILEMGDKLRDSEMKECDLKTKLENMYSELNCNMDEFKIVQEKLDMKNKEFAVIKEELSMNEIYQAEGKIQMSSELAELQSILKTQKKNLESLQNEIYRRQIIIDQKETQLIELQHNFIEHEEKYKSEIDAYDETITNYVNKIHDLSNQLNLIQNKSNHLENENKNLKEML